jgi:hypothetical protein
MASVAQLLFPNRQVVVDPEWIPSDDEEDEEEEAEPPLTHDPGSRAGDQA